MTCGANVRSVVNATVIPTLGVRVVLRADEATTTDRTHQDPTALKDRPGLFIPARGAATSRRGERVLLRSIPARAGQPERDRSTIPAPRVHPRACGALCRVELRAWPGCGFIPHGRGERASPSILSVCRGSIPARAGLSRFRTRRLFGPVVSSPRPQSFVFRV